jgi:hypothetical protein
MRTTAWIKTNREREVKPGNVNISSSSHKKNKKWQDIYNEIKNKK